jgi:hypothetical protein
MNKNYSVELPTPFVQDIGSPSRTINFCVEPVYGSEEGYNYSYYSVSVPMTHWNYSGIVNAIVTAEYPAEMMQAIMNNYHQETDLAKLIDLLRTTQNFNKLRSAMNDWLSSRDQDIVKEYETMQEWRKMAKDTAREILKL